MTNVGGNMGGKVMLVRTAETICGASQFLQDHDIDIIEAPIIKAQPLFYPSAKISKLIHLSEIVCCLSQNAAHNLRFYQGKLGTNADIWAVGSKTQQAVASFFKNVQCPELQTSEGLVAEIGDSITPGTRVTLLKGVGGRDFLIQQLSKMGAIITQINLYQRTLLQEELEKLPSKTDGIKLKAIMVGSGELFCGVFTRLAEKMMTTPLIVPSARIADIASAQGCQKIEIADGASAMAFLSALNKL